MKIVLLVLMPMFFITTGKYTYGEDKEEISIEEREYNWCVSKTVVNIIQLSFHCVNQFPKIKGSPVQDSAAPCFEAVKNAIEKTQSNCIDYADNAVHQRSLQKKPEVDKPKIKKGQKEI